MNMYGASIEFDGTNIAKMTFGDNMAPCDARAAGGGRVIFTCGAGSQESVFAADCSMLNVGGLNFARVR